MSASLRRIWTRDEFLGWVERQEEPYEFDGTEPVAMHGSLYDHNLIVANIHFALRLAPQGTPWIVLGQNMGAATDRNSVRFPDTRVQCRP